MSGHDRVEQIMSGNYRLVQVRHIQATLGQVKILEHVRTG